MQIYRLIGTEHRAGSDTKRQRITDLAGSAGDGYIQRLQHEGAPIEDERAF
jgi:hypothetical protein